MTAVVHIFSHLSLWDAIWTTPFRVVYCYFIGAILAAPYGAYRVFRHRKHARVH